MSAAGTDVKLRDEALGLLAERGIAGPFDAALVLGTGLGNIVEDVEEACEVPYADIPGFPVSDVSGHAGRLIAGRMEGRRVLIYAGRAHYYETGNAAVMRAPIHLLTGLGSPPLVLTNAAGSLRADIRPGSLALITDHIHYSGLNPLIRDTRDGRFVPMTQAFDDMPRQRMMLAAKTAGITLNSGIYMWFSGPSFETPAEIRMARMFGADLVGMSTVPEVILARRFGLRVAALSVVTNLAAGLEGATPSHGETKDVATLAAVTLRRLLRAFLATRDERVERLSRLLLLPAVQRLLLVNCTNRSPFRLYTCL